MRPGWDTNDLLGADGFIVGDLRDLKALDLTGYDLVVVDHAEEVLGVATIETVDDLALAWGTRVILANERIPQRRPHSTTAA